jgi:UDP-N-acetylglucosamine diphosphorylase/glucosamine-1-phosphate N-acetyltransferase
VNAGPQLRKFARPDFFLRPDLVETATAELPQVEVNATLLSYTWELVSHNPGQIGADFERSKQGGRIDGEVDERAVIYNARAVHVSQGARIDAGVVLDARSGPIFVGPGARVFSNTRVEGPCALLEDTSLVGGRFSGGCTFGPCCRIGGEVEQSVFQGHANKYHEGFVGHSYVGEWVNLGALTTTSDLKNTYGNVSVIVEGQAVQTNLMKVGSLVGDFAKTGIGTLLDTGAVLGFSANVFGGRGVLPKYVPCFVWGDGESFETYIPQRAVATARVVMERRGVTLSPALERLMMHIFESTEEDRRRVL